MLFSVSVSVYSDDFPILQGKSCQDGKFFMKSANILYSTLRKFVEHNTAASAYGVVSVADLPESFTFLLGQK